MGIPITTSYTMTIPHTASPRGNDTLLCKPSNVHVFQLSPRRYPLLGSAVALTVQRGPKLVPWLRAIKEIQRGEENPSNLPKAELTPKRMSESYYTVKLPFATDEVLLDQYINAQKQIRVGKLLEDLDSHAAVVANLHALPRNATHGEYAHPTIVTASVDRIVMLGPLSELVDYEINGRTTWVGRSSMEVCLDLVTLPEKKLILKANFTMVARDPATKKSMAVNPLIADTIEEKAIFSRAEEYNLMKRRNSEDLLSLKPPTQEETQLIHQMYLEQKELGIDSPVKKSEKIVYMSDTKIENALVMHPENRNRHTVMIFGGYTLRLAFEQAHICASRISRSHARFVSLDSATFGSPVPVGSTLECEAMVVHASPNLSITKPSSAKQNTQISRVQVQVNASVRDMETGQKSQTGMFVYSFDVEGQMKVLPKTYDEYMEWINAKRRIEQTATGWQTPEEV